MTGCLLVQCLRPEKPPAVLAYLHTETRHVDDVLIACISMCCEAQQAPAIAHLPPLALDCSPP